MAALEQALRAARGGGRLMAHVDQEAAVRSTGGRRPGLPAATRSRDRRDPVPPPHPAIHEREISFAMVLARPVLASRTGSRRPGSDV